MYRQGQGHIPGCQTSGFSRAPLVSVFVATCLLHCSAHVGAQTCSLPFLPLLRSSPPSPPCSVLSPLCLLLSFSPRCCDQEKFAEPHAGWISATVCLILCSFMDCNPPDFCPGDSPGKNTGMGCLALLQGIFPSQRLNLHLLRLLH